ncbi:hypothetical protein SCB71_21190 (plasmid) [Herbiconiux sp. KACC 21604]|uniref:hypothetical protein n=1 Tax=Herbiconiux sp. KACC 21604 TaxID=3092664 RepID=UPI00388F400A|nr:hypothetical protein SCB71_21190 [Herbiconiux sp. KACC 21604]
MLITTLMMATRPPHDTKVSAKELAEMLHLPDPESAGSRRVNKAFADLQENELVRRERNPGHVPSTVVLFPGGGGEEWDDTKLQEGYITLPIELWERGWIVTLSGTAIALLVILRELTGGRSAPRGIYVEAHRKREYGLSDDTWTKGTKELREAGLLRIIEEVETSRGEPRRRNLHTLLLDNLKNYHPGEVPEDAAAASEPVGPHFE